MDEQPWAGLLRAAVGFVTVPAWFAVARNRWAEWTLLPFFLAVLISLRVVPFAVRKVVPVSAAIHAMWTERRRLAKRFDSYQWQKLLWIGLGLAAYMLESNR